MQPVILIDGEAGFEGNPIVQELFWQCDATALALWWRSNNIDQKYIEQFCQLVGSSLASYEDNAEMEIVSDSSFKKAKAIADQLLKGGENER